LDESMQGLPMVIPDVTNEMGRITIPIAAAVKAKVLVTEASPFFNGNADYADFRDNLDRQLFSQDYDPEKWKMASDACLEAIQLCHELGMSLYKFQPTFGQTVSPSTAYEMSFRNSICDRWNSEL